VITGELYATIVATYAAIVATGTAIFEVVKWRKSRNFLCINESYQWDESGARVLFSISNRSDGAVFLDYVAMTYSERRGWLRRYESQSQKSVSRALDMHEGLPSGVLDGSLLEPGRMCFGVIEQSELLALKREWPNVPPAKSYKFQIWIEHSQSNRPYIKTLKLNSPDD
jgi:hypothetical protein